MINKIATWVFGILAAVLMGAGIFLTTIEPHHALIFPLLMVGALSSIFAVMFSLQAE